MSDTSPDNQALPDETPPLKAAESKAASHETGHASITAVPCTAEGTAVMRHHASAAALTATDPEPAAATAAADSPAAAAVPTSPAATDAPPTVSPASTASTASRGGKGDGRATEAGAMNIELTADQAETPMTEHEGLTDHHAAGEGGDRVMGAGVTGGGGGSEAAPVKQPAASPGAVLSAGEQAEAAGEGTGGDGGEAEADSDAAETVREGGGGDSLELLNALQCLLFVAGEPLPVARLSAVLGVEDTDVPRLCGQLNEHLSHQGLHAVQLAGGWALATRPQYADYVQRLVEPEPQRLSMPALETLAIIAYRQPITRPEIDALRGVNSGGVVSSLMEKGLVRIRGRKDAPGKPFLLETTAQFLSAFGLGALTDLPQVNLPEVGEVSEQPKILGEALEELSPGVLETQTSLSEGAAGDERAADSGERDKVSGETYREMDSESSAARRETTGDGGGADGEGGEVAEQAADGARER